MDAGYFTYLTSFVNEEIHGNLAIPLRPQQLVAYFALNLGDRFYISSSSR